MQIVLLLSKGIVCSLKCPFWIGKILQTFENDEGTLTSLQVLCFEQYGRRSEI